ncbi:MAG: TM2 domain-containing protein [Tessaracoccus sp.]
MTGPQAPPWPPPYPPRPEQLPPKKPRSKTTAALLAFLLGWTGAHNFYLGQRKRGIGHAVLLGATLFVWTVTGLYTLYVVIWYSDLYLGHDHDMGPGTEILLTSLLVLSYGLVIADVVWAIVEGIIILIRPLPPQ